MFSTHAFAKRSSDSVMFVSWRISLSTSSKAGGSRFVATTVALELHLTLGIDGIAFIGIDKEWATSALLSLFLLTFFAASWLGESLVSSSSSLCFLLGKVSSGMLGARRAQTECASVYQD